MRPLRLKAPFLRLAEHLHYLVTYKLADAGIFP